MTSRVEQAGAMMSEAEELGIETELGTGRAVAGRAGAGAGREGHEIETKIGTAVNAGIELEVGTGTKPSTRMNTRTTVGQE